MKILDVLNSPWAIAASRLTEIYNIYRAHFRGEKINWKELREKMLDREAGKPYQVINGIAVIPIIGTLSKGISFLSFLFSGTSMVEVGEMYLAAVNDDKVKGIILSIDSPGGTVDGTEELANLIYNNKTKPVIAYSDGLIASAAYWIASAADKIYISGDTIEVGSIGVVATHVDYSEQEKQYGEKWTEITAGKYKRIYSSHEPLTTEGRQAIQDQVDYLYSVFVDSVARNRNISVEDVLKMADGKIFIGKQAVDIGLVDGVATLDQLVNTLLTGASQVKNKKINKEEKMDVKSLKEEFPFVYAEILESGRAEGLTLGQSHTDEKIGDGIIYGAALERERIKGIQALATPGHESIIIAAIEDGVSTSGDVAKKIVAAENALRAVNLNAMREDAASAGKVPPTDAGDDPSFENLPLEERAKREWDSKPDLRDDFKMGGFKAYVAWMKNKIHVRVLTKEKAK